MHLKLMMVCLLLSNFILVNPVYADTSSAISIDNNQAQISFPEKISFSAAIKSDSDIKEVVLEYGVDQLTCGKLVSKAFPDFTPGKNVNVNWTWEMKQTSSIPTGSKIWWRWNINDAAGNNQVTDTKNIIWIDTVHPWKTLSATNINLHWYQGDNAFGTDLLNTAVNSLDYLDKNVGLKPDGPIDLYIFANPDDLTQTIYNSQDWTGGLAFPENNIVLIGIPFDQMVWGRHAETHELTHVLVGHYAFSCMASLPTWLNEGLAKYSEGDWDKDAQALLKDSINRNELISVRALASEFPTDATKAALAYEQSHSLVSFLIQKYSQDKMLTLLRTMKDGAAIDDALKQIYGFDQDGLEDAWRASVGAKPRTSNQAAPTATQQPTEVPTIAPISAGGPQNAATDIPKAPAASAIPVQITGTSAPIKPTFAVTLPATADQFQGIGIVLGLICGGLVCLVLVIALVAGGVFLLRKQKK